MRQALCRNWQDRIIKILFAWGRISGYKHVTYINPVVIGSTARDARVAACRTTCDQSSGAVYLQFPPTDASLMGHDIGGKKYRKTVPRSRSIVCTGISVLCYLRTGYLKAVQSVVLFFGIHFCAPLLIVGRTAPSAWL